MINLIIYYQVLKKIKFSRKIKAHRYTILLKYIQIKQTKKTSVIKQLPKNIFGAIIHTWIEKKKHEENRRTKEKQQHHPMDLSCYENTGGLFHNNVVQILLGFVLRRLAHYKFAIVSEKHRFKSSKYTDWFLRKHNYYLPGSTQYCFFRVDF